MLLTKELTIRDRLNIQEHVNFLEATGLNSLGKGCDIKLTRPRSYRLLLNIIQHFASPLEDHLGKNLTRQEVAKDLYFQVFLPFAEGAFLDDLLAKFPNRTTGDLYVWMQMNWNEVKDSLGKRMSFLAKPLDFDADHETLNHSGANGAALHQGANSSYLLANIGLVVTCCVVNITRKGETHMGGWSPWG